MIAIAITCLLVATIAAALWVITDSIMRGWHSYGTIASDLRTLRASEDQPGASGAVEGTRSKPAYRHTHRQRTKARACATGLRAAA